MGAETKERKKKKSSKKPASPKMTSGSVARKIMPVVAFEDMTQMEDMTEETVLENIQKRYVADLIYTYSTSILVSVNPYKQTPIYEKEVAKSYFSCRLGEQPPHIYAIAEDAYITMLDNNLDISMLVSGESGAGKTETTKFVLNYLSIRTGRQSKIEAKLLATVPVLEAMGNAKTIRNNNSSRFGKYILIQFDDTGFICGSKINHYLLEKFRLVFQSKNERAFHIFYMLTEGMDANEQEKYCLKKANHYRYLNQSKCISVEDMDDVKEFKELKVLLNSIGRE